jgi:hippurate hydrolase
LTFLDDAAELSPELVALRRTLHADPEIGLELPHTKATVLGALDGLPLELTTRDDDASIVAVLRGGAPAAIGTSRPAVALRADMDALPVTEATGLPYAATGGTMHACGHDLHTAILVGAARLLSARREELAGDVVFLFQPGEEGYDGAARMIAAGALEASGAPVSAAYAIHVASSRWGNGVVATRPGPLMAASDVLKVTVTGRGGHASAPHEAIDPIPVAAEIVLALQTMVTRAFNAFDPVVLTVGLFQAGTQNNIIADSAHFEAAVRTFSRENQATIKKRAAELSAAIATAHGATAEVEWETLYPVTVNDADEAAYVAATAARLFGDDHVETMSAPMAGSEDFSRILERVPGALAFLGAIPEGDDLASADFNHSARAVFDDAVVPSGAALLAELAAGRLAR